MQLGRKILISALAAAGVSALLSLGVQRIVLRDQGTELVTDTMRGILVTAENVRDSMSTLNEKGAFRRAELLAEFRRTGGDLQKSTVYRTIPVVAAWTSIREAAAKEGFEFRIPKVNPRNPKNTPTPEEAAILEKLTSGNVDEYTQIDKVAGRIIYARPIRLTKDCLSCHGDPATSATHDGKDPLGYKMEGWKEGEIHGAFILTSGLDKVTSHMDASFVQTLKIIIPVMILFGLLLVFVLRYTNRRLILEPIDKSLDIIEDDSDREVAISDEISNASTRLAEGATEQAAALEETSATLEEISGMTRRNAEHASTAQSLAAETRHAADNGSGDMAEMIRAMNEIKSASDNIAAIIKTIDEIAFQTNILALNAAVEAARAGEAGAGFAVVADEVRALAQRSAHAARETAEKIEDSIRKAEHGVLVSSKVSTSLTEIVERARKMDDLIREIASGSKEQAQGISQVNEAIIQLDKVTQANAATAEQAASSATELMSQSRDLKSAVENLLDVIGRTSKTASKDTPAA